MRKMRKFVGGSLILISVVLLMFVFGDSLCYTWVVFKNGEQLNLDYLLAVAQLSFIMLVGAALAGD